MTGHASKASSVFLTLRNAHRPAPVASGTNDGVALQLEGNPIIYGSSVCRFPYRIGRLCDTDAADAAVSP